jgi:uncharacterized protein
MSRPMIIDTDTHIIEPPDLWRKRLPSSWGDDRVMHIEWSDDLQAEVWCIGGKVIQKAWQFLTHKWEGTFPVDTPKRLTDADPANYEVRARVAEMDKHGIRMQVLYPNIGGFYYDPWVNNPDTELSLAHLRAYNDFVVEWAEPSPERFIPLATLPYWNLGEAIEELHRIADTHRGVVISGAPHLHESPYLADPHWEPLWDAIAETGLPISFHVGNAGGEDLVGEKRMKVNGVAAGICRAATSSFLFNGDITNDLLLSGVLARHPKLKFVIVESGVGWVPFMLESADYHFKRYRVWKDKPEFKDFLPSDLMRRQVYVNYWFEHLKPWHIDAVGEDHVLFETDFPHPTHLSEEHLRYSIDEGLSGVSKVQKEKVLWRNAAALYNLPEVEPKVSTRAHADQRASSSR